MSLEAYKQTTCETCLPVCLMSLTGQHINQEKELDLLVTGLKINRNSYALGILDAFLEKYKVPLKLYVGNKNFYKYCKMTMRNKLIDVELVKVDIKFLSKLITPFIVYLDSFYTGGSIHTPHFVIIESKIDQGYSVIDPWVGKKRILCAELIHLSVISLSDHLKYCPLVISMGE